MLKISDLTVLCADNLVLNKLNLTLEAGSLHVLMGPNGSGKSTLAYTLMGHPKYTVINGSILFNKSDLLALPIEKRARAGLFLACQYPQEVPGVQVFTFLREAHRMLSGTELSVSEFKKMVLDIFDLVKLDASFLYRHLHDQFSGGEKKRLEIAQFLLFKPKLAILDEIDSGLDIDGLAIMAKALSHARTENRSLTIILITHYARILEQVSPDFVHILQQGTIIRSGNNTLTYEIEQRGYGEL